MAEFNPILSSAVKAYRHKESVPKQFDSGAVVRTAQAAGYAVQIGMPRIGLDSLAARMLTEGREDAGVNEYNTNNPKAKEMFDKMRSAGFDQKQAAYAAAVVDKDMVAKRLGIPFDEAWNGTGTSRYGRTGAQHAARSSQQLEAPNDPKNADFKSYVERAASGKLTKEEKLAVASPRDIAEAIYGILENTNDLTSSGKDNMSRALIHEYSKIAPTDPGMYNVREKGPHMGAILWTDQFASVLGNYVKAKVAGPEAANKDELRWIKADPMLAQILENMTGSSIKQFQSAPSKNPTQ